MCSIADKHGQLKFFSNSVCDKVQNMFIKSHMSKKYQINMPDDKVLPAMALSYRNLLKKIGEDPTREGLLDTPMR